jgi:hypothetical protein
MSYTIDTNINVSSIIEAGGSTTTTSYIGFPAYITSNLAFEKHETDFGYKVDGFDLKNSIVAKYTDYIGGGATNTGSAQNDDQPNNSTFHAYYAYGNTVNHSGTIPTWCNKVRVIVIGAGGGGGGGGANASNRAGSGGGGGSGGVAAGTIAVDGGEEFNISLGGCGRGGFYEKDPGENGYNANNPVSTVTKFTYGSSDIQANVGSAGDGGEGSAGSNNTSNTAAGGNGSANTSNVSSIYTQTGSIGNAGNNSNPGESSGIVNNAAHPALNTNQVNAPNDRQIDQDNELPGFGQGGWGGVNANNGNGYGGQCGGRSIVRVYFIR